MTAPNPNIGIWLIGARGGVAAAAVVGLCALRRDLTGECGLISGRPEFAHLGPSDWSQFVVAGHEIRDVRLADEAMRLVTESHALPADLVLQCQEDLDRIDTRIRTGTLHRVGPAIERLAGSNVPRDETPREAIERIGQDFAQFVENEKLAHLIVINVASTEPPIDSRGVPPNWTHLAPTLDRAESCSLPASSLYAIAALQQGHSYVNFTPSTGSGLPALDELARSHATRHMGCDGKTGETLLKSTLAPMFRRRNLKVMSWVGHNIFGNMDGLVLDDPANKAAKVASKDHLVGEILGYSPQTLVSIEYVQSLGDWKTAWDHVHFQGFLGTPMTLQFIWQGCDSLLAAPLVLDLARYTEIAWRRGHVGLMTFLAHFFKSPQGVTEHDFCRQYQMLEAWAAQGKA